MVSRNENDRLSGLRVLVVEDTFLVAEMIADVLDSAGCVVVGPASRVEAGTRLAQQERLDYALLDVNLVGEPSFPVASALSKRGVPFSFLTGYDDSAIPDQFRDHACLRKPFHPRALLQLVEEQATPAVQRGGA